MGMSPIAPHRMEQGNGIAQPPGLRLSCRNVIPHARGLGSSSAAIVAGVLTALIVYGLAAIGGGAIRRIVLVGKLILVDGRRIHCLVSASTGRTVLPVSTARMTGRKMSIASSFREAVGILQEWSWQTDRC